MELAELEKEQELLRIGHKFRRSKQLMVRSENRDFKGNMKGRSKSTVKPKKTRFQDYISDDLNLPIARNKKVRLK
jgi:hypothetical protein